MTARLEFRAMRFCLPIALVAALGCGGRSYEHAGPSSPLLAASWEERFPARAEAKRSSEERADRQEEGRDDKGSDETGKGSGGAVSGGPSESADLRERMVAEAERLLDDTAQRPERGYGAVDIDEVLARVAPEVAWDAASGLERLAALGRETGAFRSDAHPEPGDIAFFHNQFDADLDGELDDWVTGAAIVTDEEGPRFSAVTRTGHAPRRIVAWPDGPAVERKGDTKVNSYIRIPRRSDPNGAEYLAGRLFAGYIDIEKLDAAARGGK